MEKINWNKLEQNKRSIINYLKLHGTERTIQYCEGILGLRYGEYGKYKDRIRKFIRKLK